jgi:DNA-binding MarR family transcriptional regulator
LFAKAFFRFWDTPRAARPGGGLTEREWGILEEISSEHFIPSMFARARDSSAAAVSKTIRGLLDKELVTVSVSKNDGRQRHYELTPRGERVMKALRARRQAAVEDIWLKLDPGKLAAFTEVGTTVVERIEEYIARTKEESGRGPSPTPEAKE